MLSIGRKPYKMAPKRAEPEKSASEDSASKRARPTPVSDETTYAENWATFRSFALMSVVSLQRMGAMNDAQYNDMNSALKSLASGDDDAAWEKIDDIGEQLEELDDGDPNNPIAICIRELMACLDEL